MAAVAQKEVRGATMSQATKLEELRLKLLKLFLREISLDELLEISKRIW